MNDSMKSRRKMKILMIDDDEEHRMVVMQAFRKHRVSVDLHRVEDGEEAMDYLLRLDRYQWRKSEAKPDLILLSLLCLETLADLKAHPDLRKIPLVLLTTVAMEELLLDLYGTNSIFRLKPLCFDTMIKSIGSLPSYWFNIARLPERNWNVLYFPRKLHKVA
jgi:two-component system, response regulator